ncbi:MAG: hypothetical protein LUE87_06370 [Lachnospiraceae bacterium]|nr:hypothetical protein [Lachnospiraceae bacterium]
MMEKMGIYNRSREVPKEAQRPIQAGRTKGFTDINPMWRIQRLTEEFGPCGVGWKVEQTARWTETVGDEVAAFVEINLYVKVDGEWSDPIFGTGGSRLATKERSGVYVSDECYKMALTDAISVSCKMLGIGADIYWAEGRTKYSALAEEENKGKGKGNKAGTAKQMDPNAPAPEEMLIALSSEAERTGMLLDNYLAKKNIDDIRKVTVEHCQRLLNALKDKPTKQQPPPPADIPDDYEGLPFV